MRFLVQANAHVISDAMIRDVNESPCFTDGMKLTDLMRRLWPEISNRLQFRWLGIADDADNREIEGNNGGQHLFQALFGTVGHIFGSNESSRPYITHQVDGFVAVIRLDTIDRKE